MRRKRLHSKNRLETPASGTTVYIDYSEREHLLEVAYQGDRTYQYLNVPEKVWEEYKQVVLSGGSSGTFVNKEIKPNYAFVEIN